MRIALVATGGTIASRETPGGLVADVSGADLLGALGTDQLPDGCEVSVHDVGTRGSYSLTLDDMLAIGRVVIDQGAGAEGVVVTHGTDSMEETAFLIGLLHEGETPIVFTGAQRAFDAPQTDGLDNLAMAFACAASPNMRGRGVLIAFGGKVMPALGVRKVDTTELVAFANSSHPGPDDAERCTLPGAAQLLASGSLPSVVVVAAVPGGTGHGVRDALRRAPAGIVFQALGIGNASVQDAAAVGDAVASGVPVLVTSRVQRGAVQPVYGNGGGKALEQAGALFAGQLSTWQTRVLLSVCLALPPGMPETQEAAATWLTQHSSSR